jgi:hypothetical protein
VLEEVEEVLEEVAEVLEEVAEVLLEESVNSEAEEDSLIHLERSQYQDMVDKRTFHHKVETFTNQLVAQSTEDNYYGRR